MLANLIRLTELDKPLRRSSAGFQRDKFRTGGGVTFEVYMVNNSDGYFITKSRFLEDVV